MTKPLNSFNSKEKNAFYLVVLFFILFLIFRILSGSFYVSDSYGYMNVAEKINNLSFLSSNEDFQSNTKRPFVYPLFLALFYKLPVLITVIAQTLIGIFSFYLFFKIIKSYQIEIKKHYLWFVLLTPSIFIYTQVVIPEWLVMFLLTLLFWLLTQEWKRSVFIYIQIITILLAFTKPIFYPLIYFNFLFFSVYFIKKRFFSVWLFMPIIVLQLYLNFNEKRTGYKHFSSIENYNLINYNLYYFKSKTKSPVKANLWKDSVYNLAYEKMNFKEQNIYLREIAINEIKQNFFPYSFYHFFTGIRGIFDPGRFDIMTFFRKEDGNQGFMELLNNKKPMTDLLKNRFSFAYLVLIPIFLINLYKWFYFLKYLFIKKLDPKIYYLISILILCVLISGPVNNSRYVMPFQGIIIVFAILGMNHKKKSKTS